LRLGWRVTRFTFGYWQGGKEVLLEVLVEGRVMSPDPFEYHRSVFLFLIPVVGEDGAEGFVGRGFNALLIPVDSFEFLHQAHNRAVEVSCLGREIISGFVQAFRSHSIPPAFDLRYLVKSNVQSNYQDRRFG